MGRKTERRKSDHIEICLTENVQARQTATGFEDIHLVHNGLPEANLKDISLTTKVFDHKFSAPLIVESMTGGTHQATKINTTIARAVENLGLGMGVGSQRVAIENPKYEKSFSVARKEAPNAFIIANLGAAQLASGYGPKEARKAIDMLDADALAIHLNPLQEAIQPEGETNYIGVLAAIADIVKELDVPVITKETGCGIASTQARKLEEIGVAAINVAGAGGTSWAAVEYHRAKKAGDKSSERLGQVFWDWGIPTVASLIEVLQSVHVPVIASGGIRSGVDAAKALALQASLVGMAYPLLDPVTQGVEQAEKKLETMIRQLRNAMFLVGANSIKELVEAPVVVTGKMCDWLTMRGFNLQAYAKRGL